MAVFLATALAPVDALRADELRPALPSPAATDRASQTRIVLITASEACACTMRLCKSGETELKMALAAYPGVSSPEVIDYSKDQSRVLKLGKQYGVRLLPAVLFLDANGKLKKLYQGDVKRDDLKRAIAHYCIKGN